MEKREECLECLPNKTILFPFFFYLLQYTSNILAAYLNLGLLLSKQQGQHEQAVHWLSACSQLDGSGVRDHQAHRNSQIQALVSWGQLELVRGHPETSIQLYKQALRRTPTSFQQVQVKPSVTTNKQVKCDPKRVHSPIDEMDDLHYHQVHLCMRMSAGRFARRRWRINLAVMERNVIVVLSHWPAVCYAWPNSCIMHAKDVHNRLAISSKNVGEIVAITFLSSLLNCSWCIIRWRKPISRSAITWRASDGSKQLSSKFNNQIQNNNKPACDSNTSGRQRRCPASVTADRRADPTKWQLI